MSNGFVWEVRECPNCERAFEALDSWGPEVVCGDCSARNYRERVSAINAAKPYTVESIGGACPTQAEGRTVDGRPYYFRARHGEWSLRVGEATDPVDYCEWKGYGDQVASGDDPSGGWMEDGDVLALLDAHLPA